VNAPLDLATVTAPAAITLDGVTKTYKRSRGGAPIFALRDVQARIRPGEFVALVGPSGCGKSTLLYIVGGFVPASSGQVLVGGKPVTGPGPDRGPVFQEFALFPWKTVLGNIAFGLIEQGASRRDAEAAARRLVDMVHLNGYEDLYPKELSGGMKQRVAIARTLAYNPATLLMDEPFGALDAQTRAMLQDELLAIWERDTKTVLFVTHGVDEAVYLADRVIVMTGSPGRILAEIAIELPRPRVRDDLLLNRRYQEYVVEIGHLMHQRASA
jgi:NitT/TauT family transport system ATP-binding protein